ncbi:MAG: hypothetical protein Q4B54_06020 [Coriobacteriales bacterium]|nr:hypothetical protein [Coriobacteriales bacterium]
MSAISRRGFLSAAAGAIALATTSGCAGASNSSSSGSAASSASATDTSSSAKGEDGLRATAQEPEASPEWVTNLKEAQDSATTQLFVVAGMAEATTTASVSMHERGADGKWTQVLSTPGFVGKKGLCADASRKEGCNQTPMGTYHFNKAFGIADDPGCSLPYTKVTDDMYWSGDTSEGMHYNEMVLLSEYPNLNKDDSEHLIDYDFQYQYCLNISFNEDGTPGRGSAIFLHCFGPTKPYTGGCVALPENKMKLVMQKVRQDCVVVIGTLDSMKAEL